MTKEVVVIDDDDGSDGAGELGVVDLTGEATTDASPGRRRRRRRDNFGRRHGHGVAENVEVEYIGVAGRIASASNNVLDPPAAASARGGSANDNSLVQFVGTKRPRPAGLPTQQIRSGDDVFLRRTMGGAISRPRPAEPSIPRRMISGDDILARLLGGVNHHARNLLGGSLYNTLAHYSVTGGNNLSSTSAINNLKRKRSTSKEGTTKLSKEIKAITKGKSMQEPQGFDSIDMYYPRLKANDRTQILYNILCASPHPLGYTKKFVHDWRVKFERGHPKSTLWSLAMGLSEEITRLEKELDGDKKMPAKKKRISEQGCDHKENKPVHNNASYENEENRDSKDDASTTKQATMPVGTLSGQVLDTLQIHFDAYLGQVHHKAMLDAIQPSESPDSLTCSICSDDFEPRDIIACGGEDLHFHCRSCLASYCTVTVQSGPIQSMTCPMPNCKALFATQDIKSTLSDWDILMIERREDNRDRRVAMAAKAMLHCECGVVAVVTEEDMGDGRIACPGEGCGRRFCAKCGNEDHGKDNCPPPAETVQWLSKHSKPCPNCNNPIEKNGGCDHMTCQPPGGCGREFWYSCGCPFRGAHKCGLWSRARAPLW